MFVPMITLTVIVVGVLFFAGVIAILHAASHAPEGYEDETGFHPRLRRVPVNTTSSSSEHGWIDDPLARHAHTHAPHRPVGVC
jgi:hypothetical protein